VPPADPFGLAGQRVDNLYQVERAIGEGGSSVVYRGLHLGLHEPIAIKCLKLTTTLDSQSIETFTRRFRDEGRLLYRLGQGNLDIVRCIASGTTVSTTTGALVPYTVLEWLEGRSVSQDLRARRAKNMTGRSLEEALAMFAPGALALDYAHRQGVVHRDVKPGNLYLQARADGTVRMKVLDFGLAKILDETIGITMAATAGSFMMCSPRYAAPEQFSPQVGKIGPWTDVYSLALVLLEALRDVPVRKSDGMVACMAEALEPKADLSATALGLRLPAHVERALLRAVTLDPSRRYATAGELWGDILGGARPGPRPVPVSVAASEGPSSMGDVTIMDPPRPELDLMGSTLAMENAPPRNMTPGQMPAVRAPVPAAGMPAYPPAQGPVPSSSWSAAPATPPYRPSGPHQAAWSGPPPTPAGGPWPQHAPQPPSQPRPAPKRSAAPIVILVLLLLVAGLGAGGFFGWRAWRTHQATLRAP
jgi:eukaryotic-like serine/threonine-protein kinase